MQVVILAGGFGTRLSEETDLIPKPMVKIGDVPILQHIMNYYSGFGHNEFIIALGYKANLIEEYFHSLKTPNWNVKLIDTGLETSTGGRIKKLESELQDEFMLTYGDGVANVDVNALLAYHQSSGTIGTVTGVRPRSRFGELISDGGRVIQFSEKPQTHEGLINGGFFVFERRFLDYLSEDPKCQLEEEPLERLAADTQLSVFAHTGFWQCMDTFRDYQVLNQLWDQGQAEWKMW